MNSSGRISQPFLLAVPILLAIGILFMFFSARTGTHTKDVIYEDLDSRMKRLEQRLARLEHGDKPPQVDEKVKELDNRLVERIERLEKALARASAAVAPVPVRPAQPEMKQNPGPHTLPDPPGRPRVTFHQVVDGDTLFKIGRIYDVSVEDLRRWNNLAADQGIRKGQQLRIER
jgi:hypothetical protein